MDVGPAELLIVLVIALVVFGGAKLPELARGLGSAKKEYEKGLRGDDQVVEAVEVGEAADPPDATSAVNDAAAAAEAADQSSAPSSPSGGSTTT